MKERFMSFLQNGYLLMGFLFLLGVIFLLLQTKKEGLLTENPFLNVSDVSYTLNTAYIGDVSYANIRIGNKVYNDISYVLNNPNILPLTKYNTNFNGYYYDSNNYDIQYHDVNNSVDDKYKTGDSGTWVKNPSGKLEYIKWVEMPKYPTYYTPGAFPYGSSNYVPSYEDTVYLKYRKLQETPGNLRFPRTPLPFTGTVGSPYVSPFT